MKKLLTLIFLSPLLAAADDDSGFGLESFVGGGFNYQQMQIEQGASKSKYQGGGWIAEAGITYSWTKSTGLVGALEYGQSDLINGAGSNSYLENLTNKYGGAKIGFFVGRFGVGGGMRVNDIAVELVSTTTGAQRETFKINSAFGYASINIRQRWYRVNLEIQYHLGSLEEKKSSEVTAALKWLLVF